MKSLYILPDYAYIYESCYELTVNNISKSDLSYHMYGIDFVRLDYRISKWNNFMIHVGSGLLKLGFIASIIF